MIPALEEVGRRFETGEVFLPEMLIAANALQGAMTIIRPLIVAAGVETTREVRHGHGGGRHPRRRQEARSTSCSKAPGSTVIDLGINVPGRRGSSMRSASCGRTSSG